MKPGLGEIASRRRPSTMLRTDSGRGDLGLGSRVSSFAGGFRDRPELLAKGRSGLGSELETRDAGLGTEKYLSEASVPLQ
jgi:hypothetical protein